MAAGGNKSILRELTGILTQNVVLGLLAVLAAAAFGCLVVDYARMLALHRKMVRLQCSAWSVTLN